MLLFAYSCSSDLHDIKVKEGRIEYKIEYLKKTNNKLVQALLPTNICFKFNKKNTKTSFKGSLALYELSYLADRNSNLWSILYRLKRNTYLFQQELNKTKPLAHKIEILEITETGESKLIANYNCTELKISTNSKEHKEAYIYYTDKVKFNFPILLNLFGQIDGVLMDFNLPQGEMLLHIQAKEVSNEKILKEEFIIPEKAQKIKQNMMMDLLDTEL